MLNVSVSWKSSYIKFIIYAIVLFLIEECIDTRREECYLNYNENKNVCSQPMSNVQTRMICCCSMGQAWGKPCQPCPLPLTDEYYQLCGNRPGQVKNPVTNLIEEINECALMPQMCNHGTCENIPGSFRCICDPGYVYDDISHQCIGELVFYYIAVKIF